jgi:hypothetical protein
MSAIEKGFISLIRLHGKKRKTFLAFIVFKIFLISLKELFQSHFEDWKDSRAERRRNR